MFIRVGILWTSGSPSFERLSIPLFINRRLVVEHLVKRINIMDDPSEQTKETPDGMGGQSIKGKIGNVLKSPNDCQEYI
jgi:hypothetical protein